MLPYAAYWILRVNLLIWASLKVTTPVARKPQSFRMERNCGTLICCFGKPPGLHGLSLGLPEGLGGDTEGCTAYASARLARDMPSCDMTGKGCPRSQLSYCSGFQRRKNIAHADAQLQVRCFSSEWVIVGHPLIECFCRRQEMRRANLYIGGNLDSLQKSNNYEHCTQEIIDGFLPHSKGSFGKIQSRN